MRAQIIQNQSELPEKIKKYFYSDGVHYQSVEKEKIHFPAVCVEDILFCNFKSESLHGDLRTLLADEKTSDSAKMVLALQVLNWLQSTKYCSRCGKTLNLVSHKTILTCVSCDKDFYPSPSPVIIVLIKKGREILLAKGLAPKKYYSCIAGFVEPGESIEDCVRREVKEEVSLEVHNIRYFKSQMWPFPNNLMLGFTADWKSGEIRIDKQELTDAKWIAQISDQTTDKEGTLPTLLLPSSASIAREMIDDHFLKSL